MVNRYGGGNVEKRHFDCQPQAAQMCHRLLLWHLPHHLCPDCLLACKNQDQKLLLWDKACEALQYGIAPRIASNYAKRETLHVQ
jgi:hypothetical protein